MTLHREVQKVFLAWYNAKGTTEISPYHFVPKGQARVLYDFFDAMGVLISISAQLNPTRKFGFQVHHAEGIHDSETFAYQSRQEAEYQAFMKAFEILESQINS